MTYSEKLRDPRWQKRRLEIMNLDEFTCRLCANNEKTLNVHHLIYRPGADPWDYPDNHLITLCESCHASQRGINTKHAFADLCLTDFDLLVVAAGLHLLIGEYVNDPRAASQGVWSMMFDVLKNKGIDPHRLSETIREFARKYPNG